MNGKEDLHTHIHAQLNLFSHKKEGNLALTTRRALEGIILSEISQRKTNTYDLAFMWNIQNKQANKNLNS